MYQTKERIVLQKENLSSKPKKVILNYKASAIVTKIQKSKTILLGDISISTQGLAGNMFERTTTQRRKSDFPFLEKGQVYRYSLEIEQESFTDMRSKPSLQVFYKENSDTFN
jgi:hypothetical protein